MDFALSPEAKKYRNRYREFVQQHLLAYDTTPESFDEHDNLRPDLLEDLRNQAKDEGLWAPQMPVARGVDGATEGHQQVLARHFIEERGDFWRWA